MSNEIKVNGFLAADAELRYTNSGLAVLSFRISDNTRRFNKDTSQWEQVGETIWWDASVWDKKAEALSGELKKGDLVEVRGHATFSSYTTRTNETREAHNIRVNDVLKPVTGKRGASTGSGFQNTAPAQNQSANGGTFPADEDAPF